MAMRSNALMEADKGTSLKDQTKIKKKEDTFFRTIRRSKEVLLSASITVEASIVLPLFIFFFVNIMTAFNVIKVQSDLEAALHQTGSEIALVGYDIKTGKDALGLGGDSLVKDVLAAGGYMAYASHSVKKYLGDSVNKSCVTGGASGLSFLTSKIMAGDDYIDIVVDYKVHPLIPIIGFKEFKVQSRYYGHAWTGYDISGGLAGEDSEEEMVYVTEHGTVYHRNAGCKHLKIDVRSIPFDSLGFARSKDGSKYYPCEYCAETVGGGNVFVTDYGTRYHSSVSCPGLKRKIYTIPISEVGGRGPCSACG
ncbi:TadE/TadG family type IV pilus assembly protein [Butyrivibrio sp. MC2021]|uniref:TadE/TadG family type IV pilus assembly protein n=1 Tax=Butyrivibrio sp. MC2021 TaxID=1408306 RepID=UPI0012DD181E|nr:TadE family protein [Butyrivibrio sp. MC2021]